MKIFVYIVGVVMFLAPTNVVLAQGDSEIETITEQLAAVGGYIERTFTIPETTPLSPEELREIMTAGTQWLVGTQEAGGHFRYEYTPYEGTYSNDDNIVRQAGALFELGEVARRDPTHTFAIQETIKNSIAYFASLSRESENGGSCIVETAQGTSCKLGAVALGLTGILGYLEAYPEDADAYEELVESYVTHILISQKENGGFRNKYIVGRELQPGTESSFSNGEALLALVRYYQFNERSDVKAAIDQSFAHLKDEPFDTPLYLWIMAALKDMQKLWPNEVYVTYGKEFTDWRVGNIQRFKGTQKNYCAYTEGIVSAYSLLEDSLSDIERAALREEIAYWNRKNARLQITENDYYRVISEDDTLKMVQLHTPQIAVGGFLTGHNTLTQRIDFTQHCISAYLQTLVDIEGKRL